MVLLAVRHKGGILPLRTSVLAIRLVLPAGVYVGCSYQDYTDVVLAVTAKLAPQAVVGSGASFMVGRLSYAFGLTGTDRRLRQHQAQQ